MEPAGIGLMRSISEPDRFAQHICPRHFAHVVVQCHGMRHDFKTVLDRAVRFAVDKFVDTVGLLFDEGCVVIILSAAVDFQFHAEEACSFTVEDWLGLVTVVLDFNADTIIAM